MWCALPAIRPERGLWVALAAAPLALSGPMAGEAQEAGGDLAPPRPSARSGAIPPPPSGPDRLVPRYEAPGSRTRASESLRLPEPLATRLRVLGTHLEILGNRSRQRTVDGVLSAISGGLSLGFGVWARRDETTDRGLARYLFLWGGASLGRGLVHLAISPRAQRLWARYQALPQHTRESAEARLAFGEAALERVARRARAARYVDGGLNLAVGAAVLPVYLAPNDFNIDQPFDYFVIIGSAISVISGIVTLATPSDAERRWRGYQELVASQARDEARLRLESFGVAPQRGGATLGLAARF